MSDLIDAFTEQEKITDKKGWCFKLRRLAGKDYKAHFKKLGRDGEILAEVSSPPCKEAPRAIMIAVDEIHEKNMV